MVNKSVPDDFEHNLFNLLNAGVDFPFRDNLKVIYHPLYSMNKIVTTKSKLPQDGAQVSPYMG